MQDNEDLIELLGLGSDSVEILQAEADKMGSSLLEYVRYIIWLKVKELVHEEV